MNKKFRKFISIFVITVFVLAIMPMSISAADLSYGTSKAASIPWTGDNIPSVRMVNPDGTSSVVKGDTSTSNLTLTSVMEFTDGVYGKSLNDSTYKTYDYETRSSISPWSGGDIRFSGGSSSGHPDRVLEFSFAYEKSGKSENANYAKDTLIQSCIRIFRDFEESSYYQVSNLFYAEKTGLLFTPNDGAGNTNSNDVTANKKQKINFEPNTWYKVSLVFDFENKAASTDDNLQTSYTYKAFVNGNLVSSQTLDEAFYDLQYICINPQIESIMYWDNINYYSIDSADSFKPSTPAKLLSSASAVAVDGSKIKIDSPDATVGDVKDAVEASLKAGETLRIYNADYTQELDADSAALGAKVVVAGTEALTSTLTAENIYTYYDVVAGKAAFDEPVVTADASTGKASGTVNMHNYTGEAQSFKGYLAVYNGTELAALGVADFEAEAEDTEETFSINDVPYSSGYTTKFFVWKADGITPELASK